MARAILLVLSDVAPGADENEYNRWYNERHLPDVVRVKGYVAATRYRRSDVEILPGLPAPSNRYVAAYEVEAKDDGDLADAAAALRDALAAGEADISPTLDMATLQVAFFTPIAAVGAPE